MPTRVLIVDDDPALTEMLEIVLHEEGFETAVASDGERGLAATRAFGPDLVLLDVMLPLMDGIETCKVIRAESGVPIIMLTAKTETVDVVKGLEASAHDYVLKPFKPRELIARIRAMLRQIAAEPHEVLVDAARVRHPGDTGSAPASGVHA